MQKQDYSFHLQEPVSALTSTEGQDSPATGNLGYFTAH